MSSIADLPYELEQSEPCQLDWSEAGTLQLVSPSEERESEREAMIAQFP